MDARYGHLAKGVGAWYQVEGEGSIMAEETDRKVGNFLKLNDRSGPEHARLRGNCH